uniref:Uncharacterized protein n=1 Tax=Anguilla anguilla TaxID=7936 RepID=A0A0E9XMX2_ANGAN
MDMFVKKGCETYIDLGAEPQHAGIYSLMMNDCQVQRKSFDVLIVGCFGSKRLSNKFNVHVKSLRAVAL